MNEKEMKNPEIETECNNEVETVSEDKSKSVINKILIGLIVVVIGLLIFQVYKMNNMPEVGNTVLDGENSVPTSPVEKVNLSTELFASDSLMLDFADVTLEIETSDIRKYYDQLTNDLSNFKPVYDVTLLPSDNIFELRYKDALTSLYFYDRIENNQVYCSVVHKGTIVGNYLIPATYYGNLFNIIYGADELTAHTQDVILKQIPDLIKNQEKIAVQLDATHQITANVEKIETFEGKIKGREQATIVFELDSSEFLVISYMNFKYYVFLTDATGAVLQQADYDHYALLNDDYLYCYNDESPAATENFSMNTDWLGLKVVKS